MVPAASGPVIVIVPTAFVAVAVTSDTVPPVGDMVEMALICKVPAACRAALNGKVVTVPSARHEQM